MMNAVLHCSDVELGCMEEVGYLGTGPYLIQSSDKVKLNPYTQNQVYSNQILMNKG